MPLLGYSLLLGLCLYGNIAIGIGKPLATAERHELGRSIYNFRCYFCHGYSGDAKTLTSSYLKPPPRDFTQAKSALISRQQMIDAVTSGKPDTAMHGFARLLNPTEIEAVVDFVRIEFIDNRRINTQYHTAENGWPNHQRYRQAYPFATGQIPLDGRWELLTREQIRGKQLFMSSCITCHDRAAVIDEGMIWSKQSISFPRNNYSHTVIDAVSSASIYAIHDLAPALENLPAEADKGRDLWQANCAFCHAGDASGENWIGSFLEPPPRNLTDHRFMSKMTRELLFQRISDGLVNTSMPAWKNVLSANQIHQIISYIEVAFHRLKQK